VAKASAKKPVKKVAKKAAAQRRVHQATLSVGEIVLPKTQAAVAITIRRRGERGTMAAAGELLISRGGVRWRPENGKRWRILSWVQFAKVMES